jgi:uncharacterized protein YndB with AHSA1/START domain
MRRELSATRAVVFQAFIDPNQLAKWFGPEGYAASASGFPPRVGEQYRIEIQPPDGEPFQITGEIKEVDPSSRVRFTFVYEDPSPDDIETEVALSFHDRGESTEIELTHGAFKTEERRKLHEDGWSDSFAKLALLISAQR